MTGCSSCWEYTKEQQPSYPKEFAGEREGTKAASPVALTRSGSVWQQLFDKIEQCCHYTLEAPQRPDTTCALSPCSSDCN